MNLEELYASDDQSYLILEYMNDLCRDSKWDECNSFIKSVEIDRLDSCGIRSICVSTHHAKRYLPYYKELYRKCYDRMLVLRKDNADRLLWFILDDLK